MSSINTSGINTNYPVPGVNNSSQGFRDNFTSIKNNLDTANEEITDLQNKVIVKTALDGVPIDNNMANTLISNALVKGFRSTTYNLGNAISGITTIDLSKGDVQYGTVAPNSNVTLQFTGWAPAETLSNVQLHLSTSDSNSFIYLPTSSGSSVDSSVHNIEKTSITYTDGKISEAKLYVDNDRTSEIKLRFSTIDCGKNINVEPINRPKKYEIEGTPTVSRLQGTGTITTLSDSPTVTGVGTQFTTQMVIGRTMYNSANASIGVVSAIANNTSLTLTANASVIVSNGNYYRDVPIGSLGDQIGDMKMDSNYLYVCIGNYNGSSAIWKRVTPGAY